MNQSAKDLSKALLVTCVPVAVAILMQKPALRQTFVMRATHYARVFCQSQADFWQNLATGAATAYNRARM